MNNFNNKDDYFNKNENDFNNDMNNCEDKKNLFSIKNKFMGTIFIIIIVVSIIGIFKFLYTKPSMSVFFFGVIFFFSGIYIIASASINKNSLPILIFPFTGAETMLFSGIYTFGNPENKAFVINILPFIILATLFLVGASLVVGKILIDKYNKAHFTESVLAECTELKSSYDEGVNTYCPVFSFYYNGKTYTACDNIYRSFKGFDINEKKEILINPENPTEYYIKFSNKNTLKITIFIVILIISIIGIFHFLSTIPSMSVFFFGVIFFFIGIYIIFSTGINRKNLPALIFPFAGAETMAFSGIFTFGNLDTKIFVIDCIPFLIITNLFLLVASFVIEKIAVYNYNKIHCTESIFAKCIELKSTHSSSEDFSSTSYCPVFSFHYNGRKYTVCDNVYRRFKVSNINEHKEIFINPENPTEYYIKFSINNYKR